MLAADRFVVDVAAVRALVARGGWDLGDDAGNKDRRVGRRRSLSRIDRQRVASQEPGAG